MTFVRDRRPARRARELLVAAGGAVLLLLALSLPVLGAPPGPTKLLDPDVAPRTADSATPIAFTITYRNAHALPPDYVRVAVAGTTHPMSGAGTDWKAGVIFTVTTTLPAGTHEVRFEARDAERFVDELVAGTVSIDAAPPAPPTPDPTPEPTPTPSSSPTPAPESPGTPPPSSSSATGSAGTSSSGGASGGGASGGTTSSTDTGAGAGTTGTDGSGGLGDGPDGTSTGRSYTGSRVPTGSDPSGGTSGSGTDSGAQTDSGAGSSAAGGFGVGSLPAGAWSHRPWFLYGSGSIGPDEPAGGGGSGGTAGSGSSGSPGGSGAATPPSDTGSGVIPSEGGSGAVGSGGARGPGSWLQASLNGGLAALGLTESGHLPTLPAVVGSTLAVTTWMAFMLFSKRRRDGEPPAPDDVLHAAAATGIGLGVAFAPAPIAPPDPESLMPRWRRPSLLEARKTDPIRSPGPERQRLSFAIGEVAAPSGGERRTIRYAVIPLLDRPDEILASRIGELAAGDEVQVEQRSGAYCHVLCPDGRQGWVHRTTLGDIVEAPQAGRWATEPEPEAENALAAMLAARGLR